MFTRFVMNHRLQQMYPSYSRLCWMIPDLSPESKPFLLHAGKQKRAYILSRQIFSQEGKNRGEPCQFLLPNLLCQASNVGGDRRGGTWGVSGFTPVVISPYGREPQEGVTSVPPSPLKLLYYFLSTNPSTFGTNSVLVCFSRKAKN